MNDPSQPLAPTALLTAVLEAQEWNIVIAGLHELPMKLTRTIYDKLMYQLQHMEPPEITTAVRQRPNGELHERP